MGRIVKERLTFKESASLPQTASLGIFQVIGKVRIKALYAEVTTAIQAQANNVNFTHTPTGGSATDMCAVVDSNGAAIGRMVNVIGTTAATAAILGAAGASPSMVTPWILNAGTIKFKCAASNTGAVKYGVIWEPMEAGANLLVL